MDQRSPSGARPTIASRIQLGLVALAICSLATELIGAPSTSISLTPTSLTFDAQAVGFPSAALTVTLNNPATTPVQFTLSTSGKQASEFTATSACSGAVPGNGSCLISVRFTPSGLGTRTTTLQVMENTKASNKDSIKLSGVGIASATVSPTSLAFGNVAQNVTSAAQTLTLINNQSAPISVTSLTPSNLDYAAGGCAAPLAPGASCGIVVTFRPTASPPALESATLSIAHTGVGGPLSVPLSGTSVVPFTLTPASISFPSTFQGQASTSTITVRNNQSAPTTVLPSTSAPFTVAGCGAAVSIPGGGTCSLTVRFAPLLAHVGAVSGTVAVSSTTPAVFTATAALSGTALRPVTVAPASLTFTNTTVGSTSVPLQVTVTNQQPSVLTFANPRVSVTGAAIADFAETPGTCGATLAGGASCVVAITFHPTVGGSRQATLNINSNAFNSPNQVAVAGVGTTPLTISPGSLAFGSVNVGLASASQTIAIQNNQSVAAAITSLTFSGDFSRAPSGTTCGVTLPALQSCVVAVVATPTVAGARAGSLVITNDTSENTNTVTFSASGVNGMTASVPSLTFASQLVGTTSGPQQIVLTNHQAVPAALGTVVSGDFAASDACAGTVPARSTCAVAVTFTPAATGARTGSVTFNNPGSPATIVPLQGQGAAAAPPAVVLSVVPGAGTVGTTVLGVVVTGNASTNFSAVSAVDFGAGITVSNLRNVSAHALTVDVALGALAVPGARTVTVTTNVPGVGIETAALAAGFVVSASANLAVASVTPETGAQRQTLDVQIVGAATHFLNGTTYATFGDGIVVHSVTVQDQTHATANVSVSPTATLGWRQVQVVTGGEIATILPIGPAGPGFRVVAGSAHLLSVVPASGTQGGVPFAVTITGEATSFLAGASAVTFGAGIDIGNIQVADATHLTVTIAVTALATPGLRTVVVTTGGEVASLADSFTVIAASPPALSTVTPNSGKQGESLSLTLTGSNTQFTTGQPTLTLGSNITVDPLVVVNDTTITASVAIDALAVAGSRQGILSAGGTNFPFAFTVTPSAAAVASVTPASGPQGGVITVTVSGNGTHWQQGSTTAVFPTGCQSPPAVSAVTVNSATQATLTISIPANACVGSQLLRLATGGEVLDTTFGVYAHTPSLTIGPASAMIGSAPTVNLLGEFTHFGPATTAIIDGAGVTIENFTPAANGATATARFVVAATAPTGLRTVTLTTPIGGGAFEVVTAAFVVGDTPAILTSVDPFHAAPGTQALVTIEGQFTHFGATTTVGLGPDIQVSALTIIGPTKLRVLADISAAAATGWRSVFVNTGSEQLTAGFRIDAPAAPSIQSVVPSGAVQGQSLSVQITGTFTSFNQTSTPILGAGVTVSDVVVTSPTTITATVAVSPTAPIGPNTVLVLTDTAPGQIEVATGAGFNVGRGPSNLLSVTPNVVAQNQIVNVSLVGQGTHWLHGGTTADFGPGVTVAQLAIQDPTHATAQLVLLATAALGFHTVTLITDGEIASLAQAIDVQQGTPVLLSSTPHTGSQGTSFTVTALGSLTHWVQGTTTATYGPGVAVTGVTVVDSMSAVLSVAIDPLAFPTPAGSCHPLTITTGGEQVSLPSQLCVQPGAAVLTSVSPNAALQGSTLTLQVTGQNTHFAAGLTQASFGAGINPSNVTVTSATTASVDLAVSAQAAGGLRTATFTTLGETASLAQAFNVGQNTPTLNAAAPFSGQRGQSLSVHLVGQYTHWTQGGSTVTFGEGILVGPITVLSATALDVQVDISVLATLGGRLVTVTTAGEIVSAPVFSVVAGGASITSVTPQTGNQGQQVTLAITGQNTNWQQGFTQFSMAGAGNDITVNSLVVNSPTSATVRLTVAPTAVPGARSVFVSTGPEVLVSAGAFVVTGGVPAIASISPGSARAGETGLAVEIFGLYTNWATATTTVDFGPGITLSNVVVNSSTRITAVLDVGLAAGLGHRTVAVRTVSQTGTQALTGSFEVVSPQPPAPSLQYMSPAAGLRGQTFTINLSAANSHFDPAAGATVIDFGDPQSAGILINTFQVTSQTTARVNITIAGNAAIGSRVMSIVTHTGTGDEIVQGTFSVVQAVPQLAIVDPGAGMQGATVTVNLVGSYTGFNATTVFDFGPGITVLQSQVFGGLVAQVRVAIDGLAALGAHYVTASTGTEVVTAQFSVTPSTAVLLAVTPNTTKQGQSVIVEVLGQNTLWTGATVFNFGAGTTVMNGAVDSPTHATLTVAVDALAPVGARAVTAQIGGQLVTLINGFVVQPGTPLILSSSPASGQQQAAVTLTILGQATAWDQTTTVDLGPGVAVGSIQPTSATALTVGAMVSPLALLGPRTLTVTTGGQVLTLGNAFSVTPGSAALSLLVPAQAGQGATLNVGITGVNTSFVAGTTQAFFGDGITVNSVTVNGPTSATANISVAAGAIPGFRTVALATEGETAAIVNGFTVVQTVPHIQFVSPSSAAQGAALDLTVVGSLTNFTAATVFDFGPGVTVNLVTPNGPAQATVNVTVSPVAARTTRAVSATTGGVTATGASLFSVTAGPAYISAVSPAAGVRGQVGLQVTISGVSTHFMAGTPVVSLGAGVSVTQVIVDSDTQLRATVAIDPLAPTQANDVVVTTGGEVATLVAGFTVQQAFVSVVAPTSAYQEQTLAVVVTGVNTHFVAGQTLASFGAGVTVNGVTVQSATQATVNVTVQLAATPGVRTVTMTTGLESASSSVTALFTVVAKETPVISWATPADIVYGTALGAAQLNATASTAGSFSYAPASGTVLSAGLAQPLSVTFTPDNAVRYFSATATVSINVAKAQQPALSVNAPPSAQYQASFQVTATGGDGTGLITYAVTGPCSNLGGGDIVTMTSGTGVCSITATKAGDTNFFQITSPAKTVDATKAPQAALTVMGAPSSAPNGSTFPVTAVGGSAGTLTFAVTGPCTVAGADVTMTQSIGNCSISATRAGDANFLPVTSAAAVVTASGPVPPALDLLSATTSLSVPATGPPFPGIVAVRLQANGVNVKAPAGGVTVAASSDNTACVVATDGAIPGATYVGSIGIAYGNATRPCTAIVTATAVGYGSDVVTVTVYNYESAPVTSAAAALSYYNPALLASPAGSLAASVATVSYYNPALLPTPSGVQASSVASVSYYNPALLGNPAGGVTSSVAAVSYYNPALLPSPAGGATSKVTSVSYYNPALLPTPTGEGATNAVSVSYLNPQASGQAGAPESLLAAVAPEPAETTVTVLSVSVANGPTAVTVRPVRLSLSGGLHYVLQIDGANLSSAAFVTLVGLEPYVSILPPVSSADGRRLTVDVQLAPNAPLGVVMVLVGGSGWTTPDVPGMRVEIVP